MKDEEQVQIFFMVKKFGMFCSSEFFIAVFFVDEQLLPNLKTNFIRPLSTQWCFKKPEGLWGDFLELFSLKSEETRFSQNRCVKSIISTAGVPLALVIVFPDGQTLACHTL